MKVLVTGSAGHLGEALVRVLERTPRVEVLGLDLKPSPHTKIVGSIADRELVSGYMVGVNAIYHTAALHKPHVATHSNQDFIDTNISGTLNLLETAVANGVGSFVFTSTTSVFGDALRPPTGAPATWVTEETALLPKNIYGVTKTAAEELCYLFHRRHGLSCIILRTSRFFPEADDDAAKRERFADSNLKVIEFLYRRVEIEDAVNAHLLAAEKANELKFGRYIISATTPFRREDVVALNKAASQVLEREVPSYRDTFRTLEWRMLDQIDRVYDNAAARRDLGWAPRYDFRYVLERAKEGGGLFSELAGEIGLKGYHDQVFDEGPYPIQE